MQKQQRDRRKCKVRERKDRPSRLSGLLMVMIVPPLDEYKGGSSRLTESEIETPIAVDSLLLTQTLLHLRLDIVKLINDEIRNTQIKLKRSDVVLMKVSSPDKSLDSPYRLVKFCVKVFTTVSKIQQSDYQVVLLSEQ